MALGPCDAQITIQAHTLQALSFCHDDEHLYSAESRAAPSTIAASFKGQGKVLVFRTCKDVDGNVHYFMRKPRPNRSGVCRVFEDEVFPGTKKDDVSVEVLYDGTAPNWFFVLRGWNSRPPNKWAKMRYSPQSAVLAQVHDGECPRGDNSDYISISGVTDGTLKSFYHLWGSITASPEVFSKAIADVPLRFNTGNATRSNLQIAVFEGHQRLASVECYGSAADAIVNDGGCTAIIDSFGVQFDVTNTGPSITGLYEMPSI